MTNRRLTRNGLKEDWRFYLLVISAIAVLNGCASLTKSTVKKKKVAREEIELAPFMGELQRFSSKLGYAIRGKNFELASFYAHELEEVAKEIQQKIKFHDGYPIAELSKAYLYNAIEDFENTLGKKNNWKESWKSYQSLINNCNTCHKNTEHAFIKILPAAGNPPFNQDFR